MARTTSAQKKMANAIESCCDNVTKQDLLDHVDAIRESLNELPDECNDNSIVGHCDKDAGVQNMMKTVCAALCAAEQAACQLQCMVESISEDGDSGD